MDDVVILSSRIKERIFLATADSVIQQTYKKLSFDLMLQIKLLTLLGYEVVTGAPFVWQSDITRKAFISLAPLLEARVIGLMGRQGIANASDYLSERQTDTETLKKLSLPIGSPFRSEIPSDSAMHDARSIDSIASLISRTGSVERIFQSLFIKDLNIDADKEALGLLIKNWFPTKYSNIARWRAEKLCTSLSMLPFRSHFSRAVIAAEALSDNIPKDLSDKINQRSTCLYHGANAIACDAKLFTLQEYAHLMPESIKYSHQYSISPDNPYLFLQILNLFGISRVVIENLSIETLRKLSTENTEVFAFVNWYRSFLRKCTDKNRNCSNDSEINPFLKKVSEVRNETMQKKMRYELIVDLEQERFDWFIGVVGVIITLSLDLGVSGAAAKNIVKWSLEHLKEKCERAMIKPLGDFEAMIIREGLRDFEPPKDSL